jgi:hypothetical protein
MTPWLDTRNDVTTQGTLAAAGLMVDAWIERRPYAAEHPSTRAYVLARRPT